MKNSRKNSIFWTSSLMLFGMAACATSPYKISMNTGQRVELNLGPDRIQLECEKLFEEGTQEVHGFMIHILDEENTVLTVIQGNNLDKGSCLHRIQKITQLLRRGSSIFLSGAGDLDEIRVKQQPLYTFPGKGSFPSNGRVLQFMSIKNEIGNCYTAHKGETCESQW